MQFWETVAVYCENHTEHTDRARTHRKHITFPLKEPNRLMLFGGTVADYCDNHTDHTDTLCGQNAEFWYVKAGGISYIVTTRL
jgi:hypothetical protein